MLALLLFLAAGLLTKTFAKTVCYASHSLSEASLAAQMHRYAWGCLLRSSDAACSTSWAGAEPQQGCLRNVTIDNVPISPRDLVRSLYHMAAEAARVLNCVALIHKLKASDSGCCGPLENPWVAPRPAPLRPLWINGWHGALGWYAMPSQ
jgi:hypothetical protein